MDKLTVEGIVTTLVNYKVENEAEFADVAKHELEAFEEQVRESERERANKIVIEEHYELEEWFAHREEPPQVLLMAHQKSMRTRNAITKAIINQTQE